MINKERIKKSIFVILLLLVVSNIYTQTSNNNLEKIWQDKNELDSVRFNALDEFYTLKNQSSPDSALLSLDYLHDLAKERNNLTQLYKASKHKGNIHRLKGNYDIAMGAYQEAENLAIELKDSIMQAQIIGNVGNVYIYRQNYKQATQNFTKALKIYQTLDNKDGESHMLTSLGSVYLIIQNYDLALEYYQKALTSYNERGFEDRSTAVVFINIGWTNYEKELFAEAKEYYEKGLEILELKNDKFFIADCYSVLAKINQELKQFEIANDYGQKNLALNEELGIESGIVNAKITIAQLKFESDIDEAALMAESILENLPSNTFKEYKRDLYELLYKCYKDQNRLDLSLEMYENFTIYSDSIKAEKNSFEVAQEAAKNDFELKLQESQEENENERAELKASQSKKVIGLILASVLLIGFIFFYYRSRNKKNIAKRNELLEEIEKLKSVDTTLLNNRAEFKLDREKIEASISRKINETDWNVLNILLDDPVISNKEIAEKAYMSVDGIGSSLRRMYDYFEVKQSKYKKISLLMLAIKLSNN